MENFYNKNFCLIGIIFSYIYPIYYIFEKYKKNNSISNIVCNTECKDMIFKHLMYLSFFLLLYELKRNNEKSMITMSIFVICSLLLINIREESTFHTSFAFIAFLCLIIFMSIHKHKNKVLYLIFCIQIIFTIFLIIDMLLEYDIFLSETLFLVNFGTYFLTLHLIE